MKTNIKTIIYIILIVVFSLIITSCGDYMQTMNGAIVTFENSDIANQSIIGFIEEPDDPTKDGFYFDGWYCDEECTTVWDFEKDISKEDITLYAKWITSETTGITISDRSTIDISDSSDIEIFNKSNEKVSNASIEASGTKIVIDEELSDDYYYLYKAGVKQAKLIIKNERAKLVDKDTITPMNKNDLLSEIENCINNSIAVNTLEVFGVEDMSELFFDNSTFNEDLSSWDVSNVTNMSSMFNGASSFKSDLSSWKVDNVTNMDSMFTNASVFDSDISSWNVSNVTTLAGMFRLALNFNSDLSSWEVDKVTDMSGTFMAAEKFNSDISLWNVSNVTNMAFMFRGTSSFNQDISNWNVDKVDTYIDIFEGSAIIEAYKPDKFK